MTEILLGKNVADKIRADIVIEVERFKEKGISPKLGIIRVGNDESDISYEKGILSNAAKVGIEVEVFNVQDDINTEELLEVMEKLNNDKNIHGILMFRPLPKSIDQDRLIQAINPDKDVDCMHPLNLAKIFEGNFDGFEPATPRAAVEMLIRNDYDLNGKNVVVINRSMVVGKPLAMMLLDKNATVTICHSRTKNLQEICKNADIVIPALGRANMLGKDYFNEKSVIIDVGVSPNKDNTSITGDADYDNLCEYVSAITPVPRGVGTVTAGILLNQVVKACKIQNK